MGGNDTVRGVVARGIYGGNLAGAVAGSLLAGFYLLRLYDMPTATIVAVALNVVVAAIALALAAVTRHEEVRTSPSSGTVDASLASGSYVAIALSGLTALGAEVVDAPAVAALRRHDVHLLAHPRGVPLGLGIGSTIGSQVARAFCPPAHGARRVSVPAVR